jgi:type I restriction enzyme M protein
MLNKALDDDTLADFIQNFDKIPLKDSDFEFPRLVGGTAGSPVAN